MQGTIYNQSSVRLFMVRRPNNDCWGWMGLAKHHAILEQRDDGSAFIHERVEGHAGLVTISYDPQVLWEKIEAIPNAHAAMQRLQEVRRWGPYSLLFGNCEHAVQYIAHGTARSMQISKMLCVATALVVGGAYFLGVKHRAAVGAVA